MLTASVMVRMGHRLKSYTTLRREKYQDSTDTASPLTDPGLSVATGPRRDGFRMISSIAQRSEEQCSIGFQPVLLTLSSDVFLSHKIGYKV
jgi:hypothetical protein